MMLDASEHTRPHCAVLGAGTWGIVLAKLLSANGAHVRVWDYFPEVVEEITATRKHPKLPGFEVPADLELSSDMAEVMSGANVVVVVVPSMAMRATFEGVRATGAAAGVDLWVICSKGVEQGTLFPMHEVFVDVLGEPFRDKVGAFGGPTHAEEVGRGLPATIVAAAEDISIAERIQQLFFCPTFRVYTQRDILGVELGGAIKNVVAIAAGISDGMGFGDNSRAALVTRGLAEITRLGEAMGAQRETFMGLSGLGDLVVTTGSPHSRNHRFGELLAQGKTCEQALEGVGMVVEGYATAASAQALAEKHNVEMPITRAVHEITYKGRPAAEAIKDLLGRAAKSELE